MLEIEITQQRSIRTTKWEIILGMKIKLKKKFFLFVFVLSGMSLYQVIKLLKQNDEQIKSVILVYNDKVNDIVQKTKIEILKFCFIGSIKCGLYT